MTGNAPFSLRDVQQWMQSVVTHPGGVEPGAEATAGARAIDSVITRSQALSSVERLDIYNRSYFARLLECMRAEYSVLAGALGDELFDAFAVGYLRQYPPRSYTLGDLGDRFPDYLAETRPSRAMANDAARFCGADPMAGPDGSGIHSAEEGEAWPEFLIDLARLERTINVVFDGPGAEGSPLVDRERLSAIPPERWADTRLKCVPCLRLLALSYPINDYFTAIRRGRQPVGIDIPRNREQPEIPDRQPSHLAVTRRDYRVHRYPLAAEQFHLLGALLEGETIGTAIERAAAVSNANDKQFANDLHNWFFQWTAAGFFEDVR